MLHNTLHGSHWDKFSNAHTIQGHCLTFDCTSCHMQWAWVEISFDGWMVCRVEKSQAMHSGYRCFCFPILAHTESVAGEAPPNPQKDRQCITGVCLHCKKRLAV